MSDTNFMSYSDAETVVTGIADKYKTFKGTQAQWDALSLAEKVKYSFADITDDYAGTGVVDAVTNGDMNPVSSNAVHKLYYGWNYAERVVTVTGQTGETYSQLLIRLQSLIDYDKVSQHSRIKIDSHYYTITQCSVAGRWLYATNMYVHKTDGINARGVVLSDDNGGSASLTLHKYVRQSDGIVKDTLTDQGAQSASGKKAYMVY